ncbi:MAG: CDP-archaeol synthase [Pseudomonadota bacterium]
MLPLIKHLSETHLRLISALLLILILIIASRYPLLVFILTAIVLTIAVYEAAGLLKIAPLMRKMIAALSAMGSLFPILSWMMWSYLQILIGVSIIFLLSAYLAGFNQANMFMRFKKSTQMLLFQMWLFFCMYCLVEFYLTPAGLFDISFIIIIVAISDSSAWLIGRTLKGPKLIPSISPNKTWSGSIGALICALLVGLLINHYFFWQTITETLIISAIITISAQIGDLSISFIKRKTNVKDTGNLIPGHGGILDRIDGFLLALPCAWSLNLWF